MRRPLIAVITYNEEDNIVTTLEDLERFRHLYDIVVVDNCSGDNTALLCQERHIATLRHCVNSGSSFGTLQTYFRYAHESGYSILVQFDGDGQHVADELEKIINPVSCDVADFVIGSRFIDKKGFQSFLLRRAAIKGFGILDSFLTGTKLTDVTSGFRCYGPRAIDLLGYRFRTQIYDPNQLVLSAHFAGLRIMEVPVMMRERRYGRSEFRDILALAYPLKGAVNIIGCILQKHQIERMARRRHGI